MRMIVTLSVITTVTLRRNKNVAEWKRIANFTPILKWKSLNRNQGEWKIAEHIKLQSPSHHSATCFTVNGERDFSHIHRHYIVSRPYVSLVIVCSFILFSLFFPCRQQQRLRRRLVGVFILFRRHILWCFFFAHLIVLVDPYLRQRLYVWVCVLVLNDMEI